LKYSCTNRNCRRKPARRAKPEGLGGKTKQRGKSPHLPRNQAGPCKGRAGSEGGGKTRGGGRRCSQAHWEGGLNLHPTGLWEKKRVRENLPSRTAQLSGGLWGPEFGSKQKERGGVTEGNKGARKCREGCLGEFCPKHKSIKC